MYEKYKMSAFLKFLSDHGFRVNSFFSFCDVTSALSGRSPRHATI